MRYTVLYDGSAIATLETDEEDALGLDEVLDELGAYEAEEFWELDGERYERERLSLEAEPVSGF